MIEATQQTTVDTWTIELWHAVPGEWYKRRSLGPVGEPEAVREFQALKVLYPNSTYRLVMEKSVITYSRVVMDGAA